MYGKILRIFAAIFLACSVIMSPARAAIIGYNYLGETDVNCTVNGIVNPCFVRGMFELDSDEFTLDLPGQAINPLSLMFELVSVADGTILDTAGPFGEAISFNQPDGTFSFLSIVSLGPDDLLVRMTNQGWQWLTADGGTDPAFTIINAGSTIDPLITAKVVPLPAAIWLFLTALCGIGILGRRSRTSAAV